MVSSKSFDLCVVDDSIAVLTELDMNMGRTALDLSMAVILFELNRSRMASRRVAGVARYSCFKHSKEVLEQPSSILGLIIQLPFVPKAIVHLFHVGKTGCFEMRLIPARSVLPAT